MCVVLTGSSAYNNCNKKKKNGLLERKKTERKMVMLLSCNYKM